MSAELAPLARISGLRHSFSGARNGPAQIALDGIDAVISPGMITGVVGPDGAGKTTLLRLLAGLLRPSEGRIEVFGLDLATHAQVVHDRIGYMPQRFGLYDDLSVAGNIALHADLHAMPGALRGPRVEMLLAATGLAPFTDRLAGKLSGGMKQKLGLVCALLARPKLLLLDEPSVGVDPASRRELWAIVAHMLAEGLADGMGVVWATAYLDEAERCGRVLLLHEGRLLADATPEAVMAPMRGRVFLLDVPPGVRRAAVRQAGSVAGVADASVQGDCLRIVLRPGAAPPDPVVLGGTAIRPATPRLEDGFIDRLGTVTPATLPPPPARRSAGGPAIEVAHLVRRFGDFVAVDDVNFSVARGEIFGLLGPNGAGKSTIFRMLCGLLRPSAGQARVAGGDLIRAPAAARARLGYMAQRFSLYGELTARENLNFFARVYGLSRAAQHAAVTAALDHFELVDIADQVAGDLPLGVKQRLALAASLLHAPDILFLDEPTSGVDPLARRAFWARIGTLAEAGVTVLVTSHFMDEAEYCDRLAIVSSGRMIATGTPAELRGRVRTEALPDPTLEDAFIALVGADLQARAA